MSKEEIRKQLAESGQTTFTLGESKDEFETVATHFGFFKGQFSELVGELSTGELRRLAKALIEYPLTDKDILGSDSRETLKNAFRLGDSLLQSKMIMWMLAMQEKEAEKQALLASQEKPPEESKEQTNG